MVQCRSLQFTVCSMILKLRFLPLDTIFQWKKIVRKTFQSIIKVVTQCKPLSRVSLWTHGLYSPRDSAGQNTGVGSRSLLQGIFPTQGSNPGLPHCRQILYQLSHKGSPRILEWVACPAPADLPDSAMEPGSPALQAILYQLSY